MRSASIPAEALLVVSGQGLFSKSDPQEDDGEGEHAEVVDGALLVAGGHAAVLLEAVDRPLEKPSS